MSSPALGESSSRRTNLKRHSDSDDFTNTTTTPSSSRRIDIDCSPPKRVRFSDHFPSLSQPSDTLTTINLKQHNKRIACADDANTPTESSDRASQSQSQQANCVMRAWLRDRYDFEWIWASRGGSGSTDDASFDVADEQPTHHTSLCR